MDQKTPTPMDSKFRFVLVVANRAEQIMRGARPKIDAGKLKPTRVALEEVHQDLVEWGYGPAPQPEPEEGAEASGTEEPAAAEVH